MANLTSIPLGCDNWWLFWDTYLQQKTQHWDHFHIPVTLNGRLRHICDSRTNVAQLSHKSLANSSLSLPTCCTTVMLYWQNTRKMFKQWNCNIYHQWLSNDVLANVVRLSLEGRAKVAWLLMFCQKMINQEKLNILATINLQTSRRMDLEEDQADMIRALLFWGKV